MHTSSHYCSKSSIRRGAFAPLLTGNIGNLSDYAIKHLKHLNQVPPSVPRQGMTYLQAKLYSR